MEHDLLVCDCGSLEHIIIITYDDNEVYVHYKLNTYPLFKRIKLAFKYIFGFKSRFGEYGEIILSPEDAPKILKLYNKLNENAEFNSTIGA